MLSLDNFSLGNWVSQHLWRASSVTEIGLAKPSSMLIKELVSPSCDWSYGSVPQLVMLVAFIDDDDVVGPWKLTTLMLRLSLPATGIESEAVCYVCVRMNSFEKLSGSTGGGHLRLLGCTATRLNLNQAFH